MKTKIKMTESKKGSPNGTTVINYIAGKEYDLPEGLANVFVNKLLVAVEIKNQVDQVKEIEISEKDLNIETPEKKLHIEIPMKKVKKQRKKKSKKV